MIYPSNYEDKIGFASIRNILSEICLCTLGQQKIAEMKFSTNHKYIVYRMKQTMEFVRILDSEDFPEHNFIDMRAPLKRINIENTFLEVNELSDLQKSLSSIGMMISYLNRIEEKTETYKYPTLQTLTENTHQFQHIIDAIGRILDKFGNIKDSASPDLARIRRELSYTAGSISRSLNSILRQAQNDGLIDKDLSPTIRDGRLVLPVSPSMKRRIKGIIHDESDTGKTVYIEPSEVVEANNKIRELEADERREIQRILLEITNKIRPEVHDIEQNFEFLAEIDFTRAKAKFAINTKSIQPEISTKPEIDWSIAIHPLLEKSLKKNGKSVVPLDIKLSSKNRILLISGPNAGGKSVCLKTVGLLQYMLQCGMPIPVAPSSTAGIFRSIFIDIGDEQSLEDDLSTYSSHLLNMKNMMKGCDGNSLILIDEFGGGTEPQIGGAIAEAILKRFNTTGSYGIITTHYQNLKEYAQNTPGIINGAMLYDRQNMQPLFQLRIGNPGSSFAIEIARKTGIPEEVIADATEIVGKDYISADKYLQDILRDKKYWEKKRESVHKQEKIMNQIISQHETEIQTLHEERKKILTKAKEEAQQLIKDSNAKIERTIKEIKEAQAEKESTKFIRQSLNEFKESIESQNDAEMEDKIQRQMNKILARKERIRNKNKQEKTVHQTDKGETSAKSIAKHTHLETSFVAGDYVRIKGQNTVGQIKQINNKQAQVTFGMIITNIKISQLEHAEKPEIQKRASTFVTKITQDDIRERKLNFKQDIDVRGMRADEAIQAITYFIDDAIVANVSPVRILHGTGSGILRTILRQHLSTISGVKSFRDEHVDFGGAGITIVNLD
ncbi:MAG: Smr/MutS family protein [Bacteroidaceae bacterium]|nr:Smr/MutS family protein [Bacteroidaceae bacterium]